MKLNRYNYEEYFILYMDNELSSDDRREVEMFLQENPDLKAELDMLLHSRLAPDTDIHFTDKGSLMRFGSNSVNMTNYEEWLLSYIDDELDNEERKEVEDFIAANPAVQKELGLLQKAKLQPEEIVFPGKESLYRREEKVKVIAMRWWRLAAAAVLLIGIATAGIVLLNNKSENGQGKVADGTKTDTPVNPNNKSATPVQQQVNSTIDKKKEIAKNTSKKENELSSQKNKKHQNSKPENDLAIEKKNEQPKEEKKEEAFAKNDDQKPSNNLARPEQNPHVISGDDKKDGANPATDNLLTKKEQKTVTDPVTPETANPYNNPKATGTDKNNGVTFASQQKEKGGIRGFLRKVTRTFEKRTNIKATDDDDRLLIAGLAIKMN